QEPHLTTLIDPDTDPSDRDNNIIEWVRERWKFDRTGKTQLTKKRKQELNNFKDSGLKRELQTPVLSYFHMKFRENTDFS
ncbi:MAG: hypothetical protein WB975_14940, partial [Nitrososphaeraceae archaeon]